MISSGLQVAAASWSFHLGSRRAAPQWGRVGGFAVGHEHVIGRDGSRRASKRARPAPVQSFRIELIR